MSGWTHFMASADLFRLNAGADVDCTDPRCRIGGGGCVVERGFYRCCRL